ncbi:Formamidopyrimidine-DNA glycosylase H2TH domain [seawater metagenome]|uniref:Formamidopyrimidine-DNA glycosylase H2TH domain n=1 Tax=seawater metagenome TaxID=1561972 RepID=A0A5E8CLL1_9ZZZZ
MPEGPEIKKATDFLNKAFKNSNTIKSFEFLDGRYLKKKLPDNWEKISFPLKIKEVKCKGKFIYIETQDAEISLWNTFGLSGSWKKIKTKYCKFKVTLENGDILYYNDKLGYGTLKVCPEHKELEKKLNSLGLDIMIKENTSQDFVNLIRKKCTKTNKEIGIVLMNQKIACGCGNYIRADTLYFSKIDPFRKVNDVKDQELVTIWNALQKTAFFNYNVNLGIKLDILKADDLDHLMQARIYNSNYDDQRNRIEKKKLGDRTVHYCPEVQI